MSSICLARAVTKAGRLTLARTISSSAPRKADQPTHTGQSWDENDPRSARFSVTGLEKQTNTRWAIDLIKEVPPKVVTTRKVSCDGGGGALGHPKIYINLDPEGPQSCNYCGLRFVLDKGHH